MVKEMIMKNLKLEPEEILFIYLKTCNIFVDQNYNPDDKELVLHLINKLARYLAYLDSLKEK